MLRGWLAALALAGLAGCTVIVGGPPAQVVVAPPRFVAIADTSVSYAPDYGEDIFLYGGLYYRFFGGVWYRCGRWGEPWARVTVVPRAFLMIPPGHAKYGVVQHHPDYRPPAARPHDTWGPPGHSSAQPPQPHGPVVVARPRLTVIAGTSISFAADLGEDVFFCGGSWYRCSGASWSVCANWGEPWRPAANVPDEFLKIPPGHAKYAVVARHPGYRQWREKEDARAREAARDKDKDKDKGKDKEKDKEGEKEPPRRTWGPKR